MPETPSSATTEADEIDAKSAHGADRSPTADESMAADEAAEELNADGDLEEVSENYKEAMERGANVKGEGQI